MLALVAGALLLGCGTSDPGAGAADLGPGPPDLSPLCLPVEPEPPALDPACPVVKPAAADALDETLALEGLDRCTLSLPTAGYAGGRDGYRLPFYDAVHDHPVNAPGFARTLTTRLDEAARSPTPVANQLVVLGNRLGPPLVVCAADPVLDAGQPLARAVARLIRDGGGSPSDVELEAAAAPVPLDLQQALARVVLAVDAANADWQALTQGLSSDDLATLAAASGLALVYAGGGPPDLSSADNRKLLSRTWDEHALLAAAARLAASVESAGLSRFAGRGGFSFDVSTPLGRVVLRDAADHTYEDDGSDGVAVLVDTGGNDTYLAPVGAVGGSQMTAAGPLHVAVAIDLGGKDHYGYTEMPTAADTIVDKARPGVARLPSDSDGRYTRHGVSDDGPVSLSDQVRQGGARLGFALLFDLGSDSDHYRSLRMSQGFGCAGVGALFDQGGDDVYEGEAGVQGAALFGAGLLLDGGGDDTYRTYTESQGFAYVRGAGLLYDLAGDDRYLADSGIPALGGDPIYYSPQAPCDGPGAPCGNSSFVQGVGFGRRAPGGADNVYMSGGIGILRDVVGQDVYVASIFGQASGYWFGTGVLADGGGDDAYDGWWYTQGSAAHAALAVFLDDAGDDRYDLANADHPPYATNTGQGHDYSVGWQIDLGGNDSYRAPGLGLGGGNANGAGLLVNVGGDDTYQTPGGTVLGGAAFDLSAGRPQTLACYGLFLDIGGHDAYQVPADPRLQPPPADNTHWQNPRDDPPFNDRSVGVDRASGAVSFPWQ